MYLCVCMCSLLSTAHSPIMNAFKLFVCLFRKKRKQKINVFFFLKHAFKIKALIIISVLNKFNIHLNIIYIAFSIHNLIWMNHKSPLSKHEFWFNITNNSKISTNHHNYLINVCRMNKWSAYSLTINLQNPISIIQNSFLILN